MTELWDIPCTEPPQAGEGADRVMVWSHNDGLADQPTYWVQHGAAEPVVLLDPNSCPTTVPWRWSVRHCPTTAASSPSCSPRRAVTVSNSPFVAPTRRSRRPTRSSAVHEHRLAGRRLLLCALARDRTRVDGTGEGPSVHYHRIGTEQADDPLVFHNDADPEPIYMVELEDLRYLVLADVLGTDRRNGLLYLDLVVHGEDDLARGAIDPAAWVRLVERGAPPTTSCSTLPTATTAAFSCRPTATPRTGASSPSICGA